ncbi:MAG: SAM-dependent methyltransferase [Prolixibacteraceae bacterium]|nr:SAM-dependent methyltransferase [Prolixibacteraceae bacterium]
MILEPAFDPIGNAIFNYHHHKDNTPINVSSAVVEDEQMPPEYFFRSLHDMPMLERLALKYCSGKILDVGAGAGCHSLYLQQQQLDVTALEISTLCCKVMKDLGIHKVVNKDILTHAIEKYDTILLLMNGIGIAGSIHGLGKLLIHLREMLLPKGRILLDSSDLMYLYEQEDGSILFDINAENYYGEIDYLLTYKKIIGHPFKWLFADHVLLSEIAEQCGLRTKVIEYGPHYDYLAELTLI